MLKREKNKAVNALRKAIFKVFYNGMIEKVSEIDFLDVETMTGFLDTKAIKAMINDNTYTGDDDPGQWGPEAVAIVHCESGLDAGAYDSFYSERWFKVDEILQAQGINIFHELVNGAVISFWEN